MDFSILHLAVVLAFATLVYLYRWLTRNNDYFHDKPIPSMAVELFFGSSRPLVLKKVTFSDFIQSIYNKYSGVKVFGMFETITPFFVIRDPELIKQIGIKDFDHFVDHRPTFGLYDEESAEHPNALFRKTLFSMTGQRWKEMRATLSPAFTGSKMRLMFSLMGECFDEMIDHHSNKAQSTGRIAVEVKDMISRLSVNIIASCAFGIKVNCYQHQQHEFLQHGRRIVDFGRPIAIAKMMTMRIVPKLSSRLGVDIVDKEQGEYFTKVFQDTIKARGSHGIVRNDMVDLLLQARKGTLKHQEEKHDEEGFATVQESDLGKVEVTKRITDPEMIAQCLVFFLGGFDTVSSCATFMAYELVRNPDIQQKLYDEVREMNKELNGKSLTYDALQKMKYMDMVVSETLRIWPLAPAVDRLCTKDYTVDDGQGLRFTIDKGTCVWFPAAGLHFDPQYFPNPEKFDPERFSDENKNNINLGAYLPFGIGPRNCIGSRFALMEVKAVMYYILLKFSIVRGAKTQIPIDVRKGFTNVGPVNGMHVELQLRPSRMDISFVHLAGVLALVTLVYLYRWLTRNNDYFHDKPIPSMAVKPFFGASGPLLLRKVTFTDFIQSIYNKYPGVKVFGMFETITPFFVIRDPELIKQIGIKDFDHFVDHRPTFGSFDAESAEHPNALFRKTLFSMTGQRWKEMRATLSPAFTGSKMRLMFSLMAECFDGMIDHYSIKAKNTGRIEVEVKDMMCRVSANIIAICAFGIKVDCFKEQQHEFLYHGSKMMNSARPAVIVRMMAMRIFPKLSSRLGLDLIDPEQAEYFTKVFHETIKARGSQGIVRHDMIDLLLQARKGTLKQQEENDDEEGFATVQESDLGKVEVTKRITDSEMVAQCLVFFLGGFDAVSTCAMLMAYELVRHPDIQQKLFNEIERTNKDLNGKSLTYDALQKMKYMDMVVSETLRMWPSRAKLPATDRLCTKDYTVDDGQGLRFTIDKGTCVWFPAAGLHHDPQYFPDPDKFDPERFSDENKNKINLGAYLPFGIGPRNCIGSRFALMEVKAVMYYILLKFSIVRGAKTQIPIQMRKGFTNLGPANGMHVELQLR
ncbi:uncharacterized protein LOC134221394 [Armigeres subalbatus]|uniref:uncharacterized protein LOC134221394 n=1 Tax=Armigeres subalbatus TaxID=124917 RepID=UPI002ED5F85B